MKQLTDEQIVDEMPADLFNQNYIQLQIQFGLNVIAKFCKENNLTGEAQPAADDKAGGEPVGWMHKGGHVQIRAPYLSDEAVKGYSTNGQWTPLYTRPQPQAEAVRVPEGWDAWEEKALTLGMDYAEAGLGMPQWEVFRDHIRSARAMLAAAPKPGQKDAL